MNAAKQLSVATSKDFEGLAATFIRELCFERTQMNDVKVSPEDVWAARRVGNGEISAVLRGRRVEGKLLACRPDVAESAKDYTLVWKVWIQADDVWVTECRLADLLSVGPRMV